MKIKQIRSAWSFCLWILPLVVTVFIPRSSEARQVYELAQSQKIIEKESDNGLPGSRFEWNPDQLPDHEMVQSRRSEQSYQFTGDPPLPFTGLAVGWKTANDEVDAEQFRLEIRSRTQEMNWTEPVTARGYIEPGESPSGYYWGMLYMTPGGQAHSAFEVTIQTPSGVALTQVLISAADARFEGQESVVSPKQSENIDLPVIIRRDEWWGNLPENEREPEYEPEFISISHAIVHHTVTSNEPPDPGQVLRNIWDWHVNENGWLDIGYNFLIDHHGNIYQGRYNPSLEDADVRGAHAGRANGRSVGIGLIGQFEPGSSPAAGMPESAALDALTELIAWRFTQNSIDPLGAAPILVNPDGESNLPRISGHRDVSATVCPGEHLYILLPDIRQNVTGAMEDREDMISEEIQAPFELIGNYPNPFSSGTNIRYSVDEQIHIRIVLYTYDGRRIRDLFHGQAEPGEYEIELDTEGLASGVYLYRMISGSFNQTRQLLFLK